MARQIKNLVLIFTLVLCFLFSGCLDTYKSEETSISWEPEKSHFADYEINGDRIKFRYSIHFVNSSNDDMPVSLSAKFNSKELKGWLKNESFFKGCDQNGEMLYAIVKADSPADVIFTFEGEYLGGEINENLSFPEELIITSY